MTMSFLDDGLTGSYSGPEVRLEEVRFSRTSLPLSSPRTPFVARERHMPGMPAAGPDTRWSRRGATAASGDRGSRDSETIVGVFELWRNTRARRSAGDLDLVPPGAASRGSTATVGGSSRISFGRAAVVARVVPVDAPFVHVVAQIVKPVSVWRIHTHWLRPALPTPCVIGNLFGRRISPRVQQVFGAAASGAFPLRFARQAIGLASRVT